MKPSVRKLPQMTWFGHCIVNVSTALQALPSAGQLMLISDLRDFLDRQEQDATSANSKLRMAITDPPEASAGMQAPTPLADQAGWSRVGVASPAQMPGVGRGR